MQLNERARARLYALTALACVLWLGQSLYEANKDGSLTSWATWVFAACLLVVIGWTGYNAWIGLVKSADAESPVEEKSDEERSDEKKSSVEENSDEEKGDASDAEVSAGESARDKCSEQCSEQCSGKRLTADSGGEAAKVRRQVQATTIQPSRRYSDERWRKHFHVHNAHP